MTNLKLLTTPGCPHCAGAKKIVEKIKPDFPDLKIRIVDITKHPKEAQKYMLMSAPGVVINGKLEFSGGVTEEQLRKKLRK